MLSKNKLEVQNTTHTKTITVEDWKSHFDRLYRIKDEMDEKPNLKKVKNNTISTSVESVDNSMKRNHFLKAPLNDRK